MHKITVLLSFFLVVSITDCFSQNNISGSVKGKIVDSSGQKLKSASVTVVGISDPNAHTFTISDDNGMFLIRNLNTGNYRLLVTFQGYEHLDKRFSISASDTSFDFGNMAMQRQSDTLKAVVVEEPAVRIKKDTVEYNADKYAVKPNAVAEDLLKKLPGVQVDKSGNITAQGETVTRVLVNGKRFFSDDPKLATRNLPPDIIDKIQVFDDLSDQSKFTGFDDGNRVKTINITTKKSKQQGYFGKAVAGVGTDETYDLSANMHRFEGDRQISLLGQANDINKQNFTIQDILGSTGGGRRGGGGNIGGSGSNSSGITTVWAGGANYRDAWSPNTEAYGSYFFNSQHVSTSQQTATQNIVTPDSSYYNNQGQYSIQRTQNHRINFNIEQNFDSSNSLIFRPNVTFQNTTPNSTSSISTIDDKGGAIYNSVNNSSSTNSGYSINGANLQFRHKFAKKFRTISLDLNTSAAANNGDGYTYAINSFFVPYNKIDTINQFYTDSLHSFTFSPTLSYTEPVGKNQIIELNYNYTYNRNHSINNTYGYDENAKGFNIFDSLFSNSYRFTSNSNRLSLNYRIQNPKYNLSFGSGVQFTDFSSINTTKSITVAHNYVNLTPTVNFQYSFSSTKRLRLNYMGRTGSPTAMQLQPLLTTSDSINFQVGNPGLKPQFTHTLRMLYTSFEPSTQRVLFATINASTVVNDIQSAITQNKNGGRTSTYVNLNGTYNLSGYFNYGFALKKPKSNLNFMSNLNYNQSQSLLNDTSDYVRNTTLGETVSWTTNIKKNFDMNFSYGITYNIARNSLQPKNNLNYYNQVFSTEITAYTNNGWLIATTFDYTYYGNRPAGYNASVPLLSPSIARQLFKKKQGELRLSVFDLLNQNAAVSRTVSTNQVVDTRTNVLSRYAMLTFTYNLNNFAGANQHRMPGMFNNFRPGGWRGGARG
ncbi:MAG TPA: TonB-dependent receptor [Puia sp.]|nr:TonB-dependent receptor [Puia sp.]